MNSVFPVWFTALAGGSAILCIFLAAWRAPWSCLQTTRNQHVLLGAAVAVLLLWAFRAGIHPGLSLHFLGVTSLVLILGWRLALLTLALVCLGTALAGRESWRDLGVVYWLNAVAPVAVSWAIYQWVDRRLPKHLFVYLFVAVFAASALASVTVIALVSLVMISLDIYHLDLLAYEYLAFIPLIALPEALLNGFVMTALVVLRPAWVMTYNEALYLSR